MSGVLLATMLCNGQALPSSALPGVAEVIKRDFTSVNEVDTSSIRSETDGRFDIVVIGSARTRYQGWRAEVLSVSHHRLIKRWDSTALARESEFAVLGLQGFDFGPLEYGYDLFLQGCAPHDCADGVHGFLVFSGVTGKAYMAKLITRGLDTEVSKPPKYDVTFSQGISDDAKKLLEEKMCATNAISNKAGLPFSCQNP